MKFLLLAILLATVASARAETIYAVNYVPPSGSSSAASAPPPSDVSGQYIPADPCPDGKPKPGTGIKVVWINAPAFFTVEDGVTFSYGISCVKDGSIDCFAPAAPTSNFKGGFLNFDYTLQGYGTYKFKLYGNLGGSFDKDHPTFITDLDVTPGVCVASDPIISGFDGSSFHFDEVGEYVMLESGDGYKVHTTFAGATAANHELEVMERSWTSSVRLFSPNGDMVSCSLPAIVPNTSRIQVMAVAGSETNVLSTDKLKVELSEISATAVLSEGDGPKRITGCILTTPKIDIRVDQVSGYEQAALHPDTEAWAAPFTWLDATFQVKKPLASPVTGILGATYPADKVAEQYALSADGEGTKTSARMNGEVPGPKTHRRALATTPTPFLPITSGIVGMSA